MRQRYFLCPECNRKMICNIRDTGSKIRITLNCCNGLCGAATVMELSDNKRSDGSPVKNSDLYPIIKGYLKDLRKRVKHSDYHDEELYPQIDGQITIDELIKKEKNNEQGKKY